MDLSITVFQENPVFKLRLKTRKTALCVVDQFVEAPKLPTTELSFSGGGFYLPKKAKQRSSVVLCVQGDLFAGLFGTITLVAQASDSAWRCRKVKG